jgi:hypothetical protein
MGGEGKMRLTRLRNIDFLHFNAKVGALVDADACEALFGDFDFGHDQCQQSIYRNPFNDDK